MDIDEKTKLKYINVPPGVVALIIFLWLILPYVALRFSEVALISLINSFYVLLMTAFAILIAIMRMKWQKKEMLIAVILFLVVMYGLVNGGVVGWSFYDIAKATYEETIHIFIFFLILLSRITTSDLQRALIRPLLLFAFLDAVYTVYQYFFIKDYTDLWFYEPLTRMGFELKEWSYERSGTIRATGFFTSPLEHSYIVSITCMYFALKSIKANWRYVFPLLFYLMIGYATNVRTFYIGFGVVFIFWLSYRLIGARRPFVQLMVIPFLAIVATYLMIYSNADRLDLSSLGRLAQLNEIISLLFLYPEGLGFGAAGFSKLYSFDSAYGPWLISLGVIGGSLLIYCYYWLSKRLMYSIPLVVQRNDLIILLTLICFSVYLVYASQFQYVMNTPARWYYVIAAAVVINTLRVRRIKEACMDYKYD